MPRTRSLAWSELKIGLLTIAAIAIAAVLIFSLTGSRGFFWQRYSLKARFTNVAGLAPGSPVRVAGVEVGSVTGIAFVGDEVDVTFEVTGEMRDRITDRSTARLGSVSLLGESAVDVTPAATGTPVPEWGYVRSAPAPAALADMTDQASQGIAELTALVQDVRAGRGTVGKLVTDDQLYAELRRFVSAAGDLTQGLQQGRGTLGRLLNDPRTANALEATLTNLEAMTRQITAGEGSLGKLLKDDAFSRSITSATTNLDTLVGRINKGEGSIGKLMTEDTLANQLNSMTRRLDELTASLNAGEGTVGQLLKDQRLYENMNTMVSNINALIANIEKDPRRYLNVRVSIF
jgi:phospholipid/cholesterol/gamma-HCH transport system substrate-binding protein